MNKKKLEWCLPIPELGIDGHVPTSYEKFILDGIPKDLTNKRVLDLAAWDGYYSHIASKRGAKIVVAIDNGIGEEICYGPDKNKLSPGSSFPNPKERKLAIERLFNKYKFLREKLNANIHFVPMNVFDMDKILMKFDVIFCFGIFYHVSDVYGLFKKCYERLDDNGILLAEGQSSFDSSATMYLNAVYELGNDPTNYWVPSEECLMKMLKRIGFKEYKRLGNRGTRILFMVKK